MDSSAIIHEEKTTENEVTINENERHKSVHRNNRHNNQKQRIDAPVLIETIATSGYGSSNADNIRLNRSRNFAKENADRMQIYRKTLFGATCACRCDVNDEVRLTVWLLFAAATILVFAFFLYQSVTNGVSLEAFRNPGNEQGLAVIIGGIFAILATVLSIIQIKQHYRNWVHPPSQRCVVRILFMVPIYSLSAWSSCAFLTWSLYIDFIRQAYEAFVIYSFMILLTKYLGGHEGVTEALSYKPPLPWPWPICCARPVKPSVKYLEWMKYGTLQYTFLAPTLSLIAVILDRVGLYGDGEIAAAKGYVYISFFINCSQMMALYCLVWLYITLKNELAPFNPMYKFLVVKGVVFFTFWQAFFLAFAVKIGWVTGQACINASCPSNEELTAGQVQVLLQDSLVCFEMFIAAAVHKYTFGFETYADGTMILLMQERAKALASRSYQRAVEAQRRQEALEKGDDPDDVGSSTVSPEAVTVNGVTKAEHIENQVAKMHNDDEDDILVNEQKPIPSALIPEAMMPWDSIP